MVISVIFMKRFLASLNNEYPFIQWEWPALTRALVKKKNLPMTLPYKL